MNKHTELIKRLRLDASEMVKHQLTGSRDGMSALQNLCDTVESVANELEMQASESAAVPSEKPLPLTVDRLVEGYYDESKDIFRFTEAFVAGTRFAEKYHGITP